MTADRVVVTGIGVRTPLGAEPQALWARMLAGETAGRSWPDLEAQGFPIPRACRIPDDLGEPDQTRRGRALARAAALSAYRDSGRETGDRIGIYVGTTMGESALFEAAAEGADLDIDEAVGSAFAAAAAEGLGGGGPQRTYGTACAAGNYAIGAAAADVRSGAVDAAVAGGVEPFSRIAMLGFARARAMTPDVCRPFDRGRDGMQLGEAAAFVVLERERDARERGAAPRAVVAGLGLSGDAFHPTAPREDGSGMAAAMRASLADAELAAADVGWVCAHGSGTIRSDAAEARALHTVFGDGPPPVSSIKGALGHSMGAATAVQAAVATLALTNGVIPPTATLVDPDESLALDLPTDTRPTPGLAWVMSCGFAFGGLNSALVLGLP